MAGIEKICEYSGDYIGHKMYQYKKNSIQVLPKYYKNFKDKYTILVFFEYPHLLNYAENAPSASIYLSKINKFIPKFWTRYYWIWRKYGNFYEKPSLEWEYCLYVPDCKGNVDGKYFNFTQNPKKVIRNIRKIVKDFRVMKVEKTMQKSFKTLDEENKFWEEINIAFNEFKEEIENGRN